jgi:TATA-box binding protein (TBP) (component of TFIID and TFIIIB)
MKYTWTSFEWKDYVNIKANKIHNLPTGVSVSTMCASCNLGTDINLKNLNQYMTLSQDDILTIKVNDTEIKTLLPKKKKNKKNKKQKPISSDPNAVHKGDFYNQTTLEIRITHGKTTNLAEEPKINMKLFKNGSVQMSGCKSVEGINFVLNKIVTRLKEVKGLVVNDKIVEKDFVTDKTKLMIKDFKIDMINSNYKVDLEINREKLYNLLLSKKIRASYEPCIRACVIVKFNPSNNEEDKDISIFVFEKGNIIITGAKNVSHITSSYNFINKILHDHLSEVEKSSFEEIILSHEEFRQYLVLNA